MLTLTAEIVAATEGDLEVAIQEMLQLLVMGYTSGGESGFSFSIEGEEEPNEEEDDEEWRRGSDEQLPTS